MIKIRTALNSYLKTLHPRIYFQIAPKDAKFPYIVYTLSLYPDGEGFERAVLDIDGWDLNNIEDTTVIENLMSTVNTALDKHTIINDDLIFTTFLDSKIPLEDTDKRIKRRKYSYEGKLYNRS